MEVKQYALALRQPSPLLHVLSNIFKFLSLKCFILWGEVAQEMKKKVKIEYETEANQLMRAFSCQDKTGLFMRWKKNQQVAFFI